MIEFMEWKSPYLVKFLLQISIWCGQQHSFANGIGYYKIYIFDSDKDSRFR